MQRKLILLIVIIAGMKCFPSNCSKFDVGNSCCLSCQPGYYLSSCVCYSCSSYCESCSDSTHCTTCYSSYYLQNYQCYMCPSQCFRCESQAVCTNCNHGYYLNGNNCLSCQSPCRSCYTSETNCTGCVRGYYLTQNTCHLCQKPCIYLIMIQLYGLLRQCNSLQSQKVKSAIQLAWIQVINKLLHVIAILQQNIQILHHKHVQVVQVHVQIAAHQHNVIVVLIPIKLLLIVIAFLDIQLIVLPKCVTNVQCILIKYIYTHPCLTCQTTLTHCLDCASTYTYDSVNHICKCSLNQFEQSESTKTCQNCASPCETCFSSSTNCLSCVSGLHRHVVSDKCECDDGYYVVGDTYNIVERNLQAPCLKCQFTDTTCTECISLDRQLKNYQCVCFDGYGESGNGCSPCKYPCEKCSISVTTCTSCLNTDQYTLFNNKCICGQHFFELDNQCHQCSPQCNTCIYKQDYCLSCSDLNHIFWQNDCFCSPGYYTGLSMECIECSSPCSTCIINTDYCTSCVSELYNLIDNHCQCIDGYYLDESNCQQCKSLCTIDSFQQINNKCKTLDLCQECVQGYYIDNNKCLKCHIRCKTCAYDSQNCLLCSDGYLMNDSGKCTYCHQNCKTCVNLYDNCTSCKIHYDLINNYCSCQIGYYEDQHVCVKCPYPCIECNEQKICIKCDELPQLFQNNDQCQCNDGYFWKQSSCNVCDETCYTCITNNNNCLSCDKSLYRTLKGNVCVCSVNYFEDDNNKCLSCRSDQAKVVKSCSYSNCKDNVWTYGEECDDGNNVKVIYIKQLQQEMVVPIVKYRGNQNFINYFTIDKVYSCINEILKPSLCIKCAPNCKECRINLLNTECLKCDTGYYLDSNSCIKCSDQCLNCSQFPSNCEGCRFIKNQETGFCEMCESKTGFYSDFTNNQCITICGDSFKSSNEECDDGNILDGDGCDKKCLKQPNFICKDGICKANQLSIIISFQDIQALVYKYQENQIYIIISDNSYQVMIKNQMYLRTSTLLVRYNFSQYRKIKNNKFIIHLL